MTMPDVTVEVAFDSGYLTPAVDRTWTDVTDYVEAHRDISIDRGRGDEFSTVQPSRLSLTLDNTDGRFTPENAAGAYYPNVKKGRPIRVSTRSGYPEAILEDSPLIYLRLGESSGTTAEDSSGSNRDGTYSGTYSLGAASLSGTSDTAVDFTAGGASVTYGAYMGVSAFTIEARIKPDTVAAGNRVIIDRRDGGTDAFTLRVEGSTLRCYIFPSGSTVTAATALVAGTTYTVGVTFTPGTATIYVNGVADGTAGIATVDAGTANFRVGSTSGAGEPFDGVIDEVSYFGSALSPTRMAAHHAAIAGTMSPRVTGYVDEWPVEWPGGSDAYASVTVTALSRMARLGRTAPFRSIVEEEVLIDVPVLYWPLGEPSGATEAGNIAPGRSERLVVTTRGTGGTLEFGSGTGPGTDDLSAPTFTPASLGNSVTLTQTLDSFVSSASTQVVEMELFFSTSVATQGVATLARNTGVTESMVILLMTGGQLVARFYDGTAGIVLVSATGAAMVNDGETHHAVLRVAQSGALFTTTLILDTVATSSAATAVPGTGGRLNDFRHLIVGGSPSFLGADDFTGVISHVALYSAATATADARFTQHYEVGTDGGAGESSDARVERYARLAGIPTAEIDTETGLSTSIAHKDTTGEQPISLMEAVALTEDGIVFDGRDGDLVFHSRSHRYNSTSAFTLDAEDDDVEENLMPRLDDQGMSNDVEASRPDGAKIRSVNQDSIDEYGYYRDSLEILTTSDNEVQSRADWQVNRFGEPRVTIPNVRVNLLTAASALQSELLAADIGTRFTIDNLPSQAPETTMDFFIEGISETITDESYFIEFNVSPAAYANVWTLDSASLSQLDSTTVLAY
jgi:hypothetical protein